MDRNSFEREAFAMRDRLDHVLKEQLAEKSLMREMALKAGGNYVYKAPESRSSAETQSATNRRITVTSTANDGPGSLRQALYDAADGDIINITARGTIWLTTGELVVDKSLTIRGPGVTRLTVDGNALSRVFHITPNTIVAIEGMKILNGNAAGGFPSGAGGAIFSDHAELTVSDCIISGNSARFGGGIFSNSMDGGSATLMLKNSTVSGNTAGFAGGGIFSGGGFFNTGPSGTSTLTLNDSAVSGNNSIYGGGIFNDGFVATATLAVNNSELNNNSAFLGGGIFNNGDSGVATVSMANSSLSGNSVKFGGGIYNDGTSSVSPGDAIVTLYDCTVSNNVADGGEDHDYAYGGGIYSIAVDGGGAALTLINSTLSGNSAGMDGGGIYNGGFSSGSAAVTLTNCVFSGNSASTGSIYTSGGGIHSDSYSNGRASLMVNQSAFIGNVGFWGGGIAFSGGDGSNSTLTLNKSTLSGNSAYLGGGIYIVGGWTGSTTLTLNNSTLSGNSANLGGGIFTVGGGGALTLNNSTLSGNSAYVSGGGIHNNGYMPITLQNTILNAGDFGENISTFTDPVISHGYNLSSDGAGGYLNGRGDIINTNPMLGPLKNNGGPTKTHALLLNSPAIDAGNPNFDPNVFDPPMLYDQRGGPAFARVFRSRVDIGAFESRHP